MKHLIACLSIIALATACGGSRGSAEERYLDAIQMKLDGDQRGFYDELMRLAVEEPDTRAGRRARSAVTGGNSLLYAAAAVGVLAAVAVPSFNEYQGKAKQAEAKSKLQQAYVAQMAFYAENNRYCRTFAECGLDGLSDGEYIFFMGADVSAAPGLDYLKYEGSSLLESMGIDPVVTQDAFVILAVGNIDTDTDVDVWSIDEGNSLYNVVSDL